MSEVLKYPWIKDIPKTNRNQIILVRHGESKYVEDGHDLTLKGIDQIRCTAHELSGYLNQFNCILLLSSPTPRARGSALFFAETLNLPTDNIKRIQSVQSVRLKDPSSFVEYLNIHSSSIYGELWLHDKYLMSLNPLAEERTSVDKRARRFIYHYGKAIDRIGDVTQKRICAIVFTHMEIQVNFLKHIYSSNIHFPSQNCPVTENAEPTIIDLVQSKKNKYIIFSRGVVAVVSLHGKNEDQKK